MNGITAALIGRLGADPTFRSTKAGKPMASCSIAVEGAGPVTEESDGTIWVKVLAFHEGQIATLRDAVKGDELYCEGRLEIGLWRPADGEPRLSVTLFASRIELLGAIGKRAAPARRRSSKPGTRPVATVTEAHDEVELNDELPGWM